MQRIPVLVTGVGGGGHGEQILKALRMADTRYEIVGGDMSPFSKGLAEVDHPYILPPAKDPSYMDVVLKVCRKHNIRAVFHGSEPELMVLSANRHLLDDAGVFLPVNPHRVITLCMNKLALSEELHRLGFRVPTFVKVRSTADLEGFAHLPAVLKPSVGSGGSANAFIAQTREELLSFGEHLLKVYSVYIVQEYVGTPDSEYTVGVLLTMDGQLVNSIAVRRHIMTALSNRVKIPNTSGRPELGPTLALSNGISQGDIGKFPEVTLQCERMASALGCRGSVNFQVRVVNGEVYVFEVNPRFSGTTSLRAMVGYNEPDILVRHHVLGEPITPDFPYRSGTILRGLSEVFMDAPQVPHAGYL